MEENRVIVDSNIFIASFFEDDSLHNEAVLVMEEIQDSDIIMPYCVVQEVATILTYRLDKKVADTFLRDIRNANNIFIIDNDVYAEMTFFEKFKQNLSFTDISLIYLAEKHSAILLTFDKQLLNLYKRRNKNN